ncbi:cytoplasmic polyadenylation element-binding protein 4-like [Clytia hemisphaerica]|uniref:RRM domain-containing protein n=1 Tax=Clytia hemisphaerica TaxID=252671 RepID=A0A7M5UAF1_9CNID|eukprot:TCONS_00061101-protein
MGDYGPTTTTTNTSSFEPFNADIFKEAKLQKELNDSKDSDEGFSSSFSPTSESSMIQGEAISTSLHLWGNNSADKDDQYFINSLAPVSSNSSFLPQSSRRTAQAPSPIQNVKKPSPALSNYLATNKAAAHSLGVSSNGNDWNQQQPPTQTSSWPMNPPPPNPIGTNANWNLPHMKNGMSTHTQSAPALQHMNNAQQIAYQLQQQKNMLTKTNGIMTNGHSSGNHPFPPNIVHSKNMKNSIRGFPASQVPLTSTGRAHHHHHNHHHLPHHGNTGIDSTIVEDIGHLTNSFSNLSTSSEHSHSNSHPANGFSSNHQDRRGEDGMKYSSLESRFLGDVFKSPIDSDNLNNYDAFRAYNNQKSKGFPRAREDQIVPSIGSSLNGSPRSDLDFGIERFSRKVFVGGLPPDIDEDEIHASFCRFGPLTVDWPHKAESKSYFPPKGYAFLLYKDEISVQRLIDCCIMQDGKLYLCVSSPTIKDKPVQIRPWNLADADFVMDGSQPLDPRKTIFVGGVPRPLRAVELAMIMDRLYGGVCYAGIDVDPELKYPKGAGRVAFSNQQSYIAAISARFIQLQHGEIDKRVEVKPYVLDDQMCDECHGVRCNGKFAPFFCSNITCLQYYCEQCWAIIHARPGREFHKPLVKEGGDRPRQTSLGLRWPLKTTPLGGIPSIPLLQ